MDRPKELLELRSQNDIKLHVKEVEKRGTRKEIENSGYNLASFDHFNSEILEELRRVNIIISRIWFIEWNWNIKSWMY